MTAQIGIELSPSACRIIEVDVPRAREGVQPPTHIRRFSVLPADSAETVEALAALRGRRASVVVWGVPGDHRQVMVTAGKYGAMRAEASRALAKAGVETRGAMLDIARAAAPDHDPAVARRPVVVALANGAAVHAALRPVTSAGIDVQIVATPATALASLARVRRAMGIGSASSIEAYVALEESATCMAIVRDGTLVTARELSWGFHEGRGAQLRSRDDIAARLADELAEFLSANGASLRSLEQVVACGGLPELRNLGVAMTERFDIEVEPLDSLFGIDETQLPEPADGFRERCADMRMVWAVAVDRTASLSLLRAGRLRAAQVRFARAAIAAGAMVGLGVGWQVTRTPLLRAASMTPARTLPRTATVESIVRGPAPVVPAAPAPITTAPRQQAPKPEPPEQKPAKPQAPKPEPAKPEPPRSEAPKEAPKPAASPVVEQPVRVKAPAATRRVTAGAPANPAPEPALPFDAVLGSILYASDRRAALIDGRIVGIGDEVRGARIVEITHNQVLLRDALGRLRRLTIGTDGR